ncbi:MAG TPA: DDE-type integrase/transposase/recombinase [Solirubrobacteraceae bacterium]|nr:DDE-type integrase/transposase/recombinase [Solirubrobacteraceae bacterium]
MKDDDTTRAERAEQIALFRYGLISDLVHPAAGDDERRLYERLREKAAKSYCIPGSRRTRVAAETLRDWLSAYKAGGFDALRPKPRADIGTARAIPRPLCDLLVMLKDDHRDWTVATVIDTARQMDEQAAAMTLPVSTVHRLLSRAGVMGKRPEDPTSKDRRRFAYAHAGELWMSDVMHGPAVVVGGRRKQKTYLIGLLDDATRVVPYAAFALSENTGALLPVLKQAVMRRGIPQRLYVDNGSAFRSHHLSLVCARLGITLIHARPYMPQGKGKQERFFRTVRMQLLPVLGESDLGSLDALNRRLWAWVEGEYHQSPHKGLDGITPLDAWAMRSGEVRSCGPELDLREMFLLEAGRRVRADRTVSLGGVVYEVEAALVGEKVTLRFDPAKRGAPIDVWHGGKKIGQARVVDTHANCFVKRHHDASEGVRLRDLGNDNDDGGPEVA